MDCDSLPIDDAPTAESNPVAFVESAIASLRLDVLREVCHHAMETYPNECCGTIGVEGVRRSINMRGTSGTPSDARRAFELDAAGAVALTESTDGRRTIQIVYHSHPDGSAAFSNADVHGAAPEGRPLYPNLCHLVLGCDADGVSEARLYAYQTGTFAEFAAWPRAALQEVREATGEPI